MDTAFLCCSLARIALRISLFLGATYLLVGCAYQVINDAQDTSCVCANPYCSSLSAGYLDAALDELAESDQEDAAFFARKSKMACQGLSVLPQDPKERRLNEGAEREIAAHRDRIMNLVAKQTLLQKSDDQRRLGHAQVAYDCWLQELEEGHQISEIEQCKNEMLENLDAISAV